MRTGVADTGCGTRTRPARRHPPTPEVILAGETGRPSQASTRAEETHRRTHRNRTPKTPNPIPSPPEPTQTRYEVPQPNQHKPVSYPNRYS